MPDTAASAPLDALWPLVGRDELVARATSAVLGRSARMVVLTGESGVGKTRIARAASEAAEAAGDLVVRLHGQPVLAAVPLGVAGPVLPAADLPADPTALFDLVRTHLVGLAAGRRVVLEVDSVTMLDPVTTGLIAQLTAARTVTLLATLRAGDPLPDPLAAQWSPDDCTRLDVPPLTPAEVGDLLQTVLDGPVAWHVTDELHAASGGTPLYLRELVIGAVASSRLARVAGTWQLTGEPVPTPALRELVQAHVRRLDDDARDLVERLAVCGELTVAHLPPGDGLGRLEQSGLVTITPGRDGLSARLSQPQYGGVVREGLGMLRIAEIARTQAELLAAEGRSDDALRVALWRLDAGMRVDDAALLAAADLARRARDYRTVERLTAHGSGDDARLLLLRGEALGRLGRLPESLAALTEAGTRVPADDPALAMEIATATAFTYASRVDGTTAGLEVLDALPASLSASPAASLMRATLLLYQHRVTEARTLLEQIAPAFAGSAVERAVHAHALCTALSFQGDDDGALDAVLSALEIARTVGPPVWPIPLATVEATHAEVLLQSGRLAEAYDAALRALRLATSADDQFTTRYIEFVVGRVVLEQGRLEAAARWFRESASGALSRGPESLVAPSVGGLAVIHRSRGDDDAARQALALAPAGAPARNPTSVLAAGIAAAQAGDTAEAVRLLAGAAEEVEGRGYPFLAGVYLFTLARWADAATAATRLERLVAAGAGVYTTLQARHARAEADGDRAGLVAAGDEWERRGAVLYAAEALASAARHAHASGDARAATGLQARADALTAATEGATTPLLRFTEVLTPLTTREREIATHAAQGASSKDIADRLFLSVRTVDNHLQSIYGKLGIRGRRELADAIG